MRYLALWYSLAVARGTEGDVSMAGVRATPADMIEQSMVHSFLAAIQGRRQSWHRWNQNGRPRGVCLLIGL